MFHSLISQVCTSAWKTQCLTCGNGGKGGQRAQVLKSPDESDTWMCLFTSVVMASGKLKSCMILSENQHCINWFPCFHVSSSNYGVFFFKKTFKKLRNFHFCDNLYFFRLEFNLLYFFLFFPWLYLIYYTNILYPPYLFASHPLLPFLSENSLSTS